MCELYGYIGYVWYGWEYIRHYIALDGQRALKNVNDLAELEEIKVYTTAVMLKEIEYGR